MNRAVCLGLTILCLAINAVPALAHPGDHSSFAIVALLAHLFEPDHLIVIALIVLVGIFAFRAGRRAEARTRDRSKP